MAAGLAIRRARADDAETIAAVKVETWRSTYAGVVPDQYLLGISVQGQTFTWRKMLRNLGPERRILVADVEGTGIVGFGDCGPARDGRGRGKAAPASGEVYTLYVLADWHGQGIGRALLGGLLGSLAALEHRSAYLWVLAQNPSRFFYERLGGQRVAEQMEPFAGTLLPEIAYRWDDLSPFRDLAP